MLKAAEKNAGLSWEALCKDPHLQDLPYKIETNERGQIVMSPTYLKHGRYQFRIGQQLSEHLRGQGEVITEAAVRTAKGTKVADVAWCSPERWEQVKDDYDASVAPEICVEVLSPSNMAEEIGEKKRLYFEAGAEEVWTCDPEGAMHFFSPEGALDASRRAPSFPKRIAI